MTKSEYIKYQIPEGQLTTFKALFINCFFFSGLFGPCGKKLF